MINRFSPIDPFTLRDLIAWLVALLITLLMTALLFYLTYYIMQFTGFELHPGCPMCL